jgi:hypothetical protein
MSAVGEARYSARPAPAPPCANLREIYLRIVSTVMRHMPSGVTQPSSAEESGDLARADTILEVTFQNVRHGANSHAMNCIVQELGGERVAAVTLKGTCMRVRYDTSEQQQQMATTAATERRQPINWHRIVIVFALVALAVSIWMGTRFSTKLALLRDLWPSLVDQLSAVLPPSSKVPHDAT